MKNKILVAALILFSSLSLRAFAAVDIDNFGNKVAATGLSYTTLAQVSYTSGVLGTSVYYCTQTGKSTLEVDNQGNTGTIYVMFSALSYTVGTTIQSTAAGQGMEVVLTATKKQWRVDDGSWPRGYPWAHILNPSGFKVPMKRTW